MPNEPRIPIESKTIIWFENSGHEPEWTEPEKFREVMINEVLIKIHI